jgi:hypothetical protein
MLTDQEKKYLASAFDAAIKNTKDSIAAASVLVPLLQKIVEQTERCVDEPDFNTSE